MTSVATAAKMGRRRRAAARRRREGTGRGMLLAVRGRARVRPPLSFPGGLNGYPGVRGPDDKQRTRKRCQTCIAQSVGVDIAKDTLEVHLHPAGKVGRFANDAKGCAALIAWLKGFVVARVAFEPTGAYHRAFERRLAAAGLPLVKVNPRHARRFAEAIGRQAKTDAVDAAMLARFAALLEPPVRPVVSATLDAMKELHVARRALVKDRVAARNRDHTHRSAAAQASGQSASARRSTARSPRSTPPCTPSSPPIPPCRPASTSW